MKTKYPCPFESCTRVYLGRKNLQKHLDLAHSTDSQNVCEICNKHLSSKQNLKEHMFIHSGEKPFVCDQCGASYRQLSQL
jgi:uncharacterized Zn-finger protein